jgi:hypothetical protein
MVPLRTADKKNKFHRHLLHLKGSTLDLRSVDFTTLNTSTLFHKSCPICYSDKGKQGNFTTRRVCSQGTKICICGRFVNKKGSRIKVCVVFLSFQAFILTCVLNMQ